MKVITTTYFSDFARYFSIFQDGFQVHVDHNARFTNVAMYPCACREFSKRGKDYIFAGNIPKVKGSYSEKNDVSLIDELIQFNDDALKLYDKNERRALVKRAIIYLNYFDQLFEKEKFDLLVSSGDSRLLPQVVIYIAQQRGVKILYFEQGPFGTTIFDAQGVNANVDFNPSLTALKAEEEKELDSYLKNWKLGGKIKYTDVEPRTIGDKLYTLLTYCYLYWIPLLRFVLPVDLSTGESLNWLIKGTISRLKFSSLSSSEATLNVPSKPYIALFLQVPVDAQLIQHSPHYKSFYKLITDVHTAIDGDMDIVVREHPHYIGRYDPRVYELISSSNDIFLENNYRLNDFIENSELCIVNNSTVGVEAIMQGKKVFAFGRAYYTNCGITYDFSGDISRLREQLNIALSSPSDEAKGRSFLHEFIFSYLYRGHFHDMYPSFDQGFFKSIMSLVNGSTIRSRR